MMQSKKIPNFYTRSGLFVALSIAGAAVSYFMYPVLARILDIDQFGNFSAIVAISNQTLGLLLALNVISIYLVKQYPEDRAIQYANTIQKVIIWAFIALSIAILILAPTLKHLLKIEGGISFIILGLILVVSVPGSIWTGYLQGHKEMIRIGLYSLFVAITKFAGAILLALLAGWTGGLLGFLIGLIMGLVILKFLPGTKLPRLSTTFSRLSAAEKKFLKSSFRFLLTSIIVVGSLVALQNIDIIMAKLMFEPDSAGKFVGISVLTNALYYVLFLIIWIILPEIEIKQPKDNRRILLTSYKLILAVLLTVVSAEILIGENAIRILLGSGFSGQVNILVYASLFRITLVGITLYAFYLLVLRRISSLLLAAASVIPTISIPPLLANNEVEMIAYLWLSLLLGVFVYLIINVGYRRVAHEK